MTPRPGDPLALSMDTSRPLDVGADQVLEKEGAVPIVHFVPAAWYFLTDAVERGESASVRSYLERATRKHGERIVDCQDSDVEGLRAFLDQEVRDLQARVQQMLEDKTMPICEQWLFDLERATEALKNLDEAAGDTGSVR